MLWSCSGSLNVHCNMSLTDSETWKLVRVQLSSGTEHIYIRFNKNEVVVRQLNEIDGSY